MKYLYLLVDLGAVIVPLIYSFHKSINFYKEFRAALPAIIIVALPFIAWDMHFTRLGVWGFNAQYLTGYYWGNIPIEEVLFFLCIPFSCLFTYFVFKEKVVKIHRLPLEQLVATLSGMLFIAGAVLFRNLHYTAWTLFFLGIGVCAAAFIIRGFFRTFLISYLVLLLPFFVTNGILTGTGIEKEVVWYNGDENVGVRVLTIPVEDFFYGMLLILLNVMTFERLRGYFTRQHETAAA